jgi:hypothetical protein
MAPDDSASGMFAGLPDRKVLADNDAVVILSATVAGDNPEPIALRDRNHGGRVARLSNVRRTGIQGLGEDKGGSASSCIVPRLFRQLHVRRSHTAAGIVFPGLSVHQWFYQVGE